MPLATPADYRILLLRAVKFHHFESENDDFPGINTFRPEGNNPEKAVSLYNMSLCSDAEAALAHAQKYHRSETVGLVGVTVEECFSIGLTPDFDHDPGNEEQQYHATIYLSKISSERDQQKEALLRYAKRRFWIAR